MANTMYPTLADFGDVDTRLKIPTICGQMKLTDIGTTLSVKTPRCHIFQKKVLLGFSSSNF